jgi:fructose-1,6-bisphosphatase
MPYNTPPVCYICKKAHPCDTDDVLELVTPDFKTVKVCKTHKGAEDERLRQDNMTPEEKQTMAANVMAQPEFKEALREYVEDLVEQHPNAAEFIRDIHGKFTA